MAIQFSCASMRHLEVPVVPKCELATTLAAKTGEEFFAMVRDDHVFWRDAGCRRDARIRVCLLSVASNAAMMGTSVWHENTLARELYELLSGLSEELPHAASEPMLERPAIAALCAVQPMAVAMIPVITKSQAEQPVASCAGPLRKMLSAFHHRALDQVPQEMGLWHVNNCVHLAATEKVISEGPR